MKSLRFLVLTLALVNAAFYCCLLPLWEGFDEAFHYAYVQSLSSAHELPRLGSTNISVEVHRSLQLTPLSSVLQRVIPGTLAFEDWFRLSNEQRLDRKAALEVNNRSDQERPSDLRNYEAQQAPLSYLALVPLDALLRDVSLPQRVLWLRLVLSVLATLLVAWGIFRLGGILGLTSRSALLFCVSVFDVQIVAAAMYHVANDWLSITAATWFSALLADLLRSPRRNIAYTLAAVTAIGLLAKAYFLAFVPVFVVALIYCWRRRHLTIRDVLGSIAVLAAVTVPWYTRNVVVFGKLAGEQVNVTGADALFAFRHIHWPAALLQSARWGLWTGNETHLAFSQSTLNLQVLIFALGVLLYLSRLRDISIPEVGLILTILVFFIALVYNLCVAWSDSHGLQNTFGPYYLPCLQIPLLALIFLGLQRSSLAGRAVAAILMVLSAWVATLTYIVKLIPYYGGYIGKGTAAAVWAWWARDSKQILASTVLGPVSLVYLLLVIYLVLLVIIHGFLIRSLLTQNSAETS